MVGYVWFRVAWDAVILLFSVSEVVMPAVDHIVCVSNDCCMLRYFVMLSLVCYDNTICPTGFWGCLLLLPLPLQLLFFMRVVYFSPPPPPKYLMGAALIQKQEILNFWRFFSF